MIAKRAMGLTAFVATMAVTSAVVPGTAAAGVETTRHDHGGRPASVPM